MSVSLLTVWRAARARALPFSGESAGYLVFLACEELAVAPRSVNLTNVGLDAEGRVWVRGREAADDEHAERDLRALLAQLIEVASTPGIALVRAAQRAPGASLSSFSKELSKALIPFNRSAARRALTRLYRETERAVAAGELADEQPVAAASGPQPPVVAGNAATSAAVARPEPSPSARMPAVREQTPTPPPIPEFEPALTLPLVVERAPSSVRISEDARAFRERAPESQSGVIAPTRILALGNSVTPLEAIPAIPEVLEHPTRPEPLASRRRSIPEPPPRAPTPAPPPVSAEERTPTLGFLEPTSETWRLGSLAAIPSDEPFVFDLVYSDTTDRVPPVVEAEPEQVPEELVEWPIELADQGPAIPLEPERDALPAASESASYGGMTSKKSDVRTLLSGFQVAAALPETDLRGELKRLAGLDETPKPS